MDLLRGPAPRNPLSPSALAEHSGWRWREREREMGSEWEVNGKLKAKGIGFYVGRHKRVQAHIYYRQC